MIVLDSFVLRNASHWYREPAAIPSDATLAAYLVSTLSILPLLVPRAND
jgi:hypothetical protein